MKVKYSPIGSTRDTQILCIADNKIQIDNEIYEFPDDGVLAENIVQQTDGVILEAHRENGELYVTIRRFYTTDCTEWDDQKYHDAEDFA